MDEELIEAMWSAYERSIDESPMRAVLAVVREHDGDAEIGRLVRRKLVSGNGIPVERCHIKAEEVAAIDAARGKE